MRFPSFASISFSVVAAFVATTQFVFADEAVRKVFTKVGSSSGFKNICSSSSCVPTIIGGFVNLILGLLGVALVGYIFYAGYLWMTSSGEEKNIEEAQQVIRNAVIGVAVVGLSFTIANAVIQVVTDVFQPADVPISEEAPTTPTRDGEEPPPAPPSSGPTPYINPTCRRSSCIPECIRQVCVGPLRAQARFTCETRCQRDCEAGCGLDGAGPAPTGSSGSGSTPTAPRPPEPPRSCRNPAGYRTCQSGCEPAARTRTASITDATRQAQRYVEELFLCYERCSFENCSP